ncbi:MAG: glycosyltransferase family 4 protein [Planctomycetes bacterium]|nr:glycosyltransferase family 4 protein [Planctomycetota bacterium]
MKVWLVNPFDPLPGGDEQLGRYAHLAEALIGAGHQVTWFSSTFSHRFKRDVDRESVQQASAKQGIALRLVATRPYKTNVSIARLRSHRAYGRAFLRMARDESPPDIILASSPPLESARAASDLGQRWDIPTIIDIQDQWPDNFAAVLPPVFKVCGKVLLAPWYAAERAAYRNATGIVGVAEGYVERGLSVGGAKRYQGVFPLGVSVSELDGAIARGAASFAGKWSKGNGQFRLLYSGSLSHNYDFLTIIRAAAQLRDAGDDRIEFVLSGTGELAEEGRKLVAAHRLENVTLTGFLDFDEWAYLLSQSDAGFNASFPDALIYLPNKIFYYMAAGLAVLNTIPGECARLVTESECGLNYEAGDVGGCVEAIRTLVGARDRMAAMGEASRRLAVERFDRRIVSGRFVEFLTNVVRDRRGEASSSGGGDGA